MAAKKTITAPVVETETVETVEDIKTVPNNPTNMIDWRSLVTGIGSDAIAADTDTVRALQEVFADEIGGGQLSDERATGQVAIMERAAHAYKSMELLDINFPADVLLSATEVASFTPNKKKPEEVAVAKLLKDADKTVDLIMVKPALNRWIDGRNNLAPGFKHWAKKTRKEGKSAPKEFQNARQQADNQVTMFKRAVMFGPVMEDMRPAVRRDPKVYLYGGAAGFARMCTDLRGFITESVRTGKLVSVEECRDWIYEHAADMHPTKDEKHGEELLQAEFGKVAKAVSAFTKFLNKHVADETQKEGIDVRHLDVWKALRANLDGVTSFPLDEIKAGRVAKRELTDEEKAQLAKEALDRKLAAEQEQDELAEEGNNDE